MTDLGSVSETTGGAVVGFTTFGTTLGDAAK